MFYVNTYAVGVSGQVPVTTLIIGPTIGPASVRVNQTKAWPQRRILTRQMGLSHKSHHGSVGWSTDPPQGPLTYWPPDHRCMSSPALLWEKIWRWTSIKPLATWMLQLLTTGPWKIYFIDSKTQILTVEKVYLKTSGSVTDISVQSSMCRRQTHRVLKDSVHRQIRSKRDVYRQDNLDILC